jgi:hypothetical protein
MTRERAMANFVLVYQGGRMPESDAEREEAMVAWGGWLGSLGSSVVDAGNPFSTSASVATDKSVSSGGASGLTGYSIVSADSLDGATEAAKGCPHLGYGGRVEVYEIYPIM